MAAPPSPKATSEDPDPPKQALELEEVPTSANNDTGWGQSMELSADSLAAIPTSSTMPPPDAVATTAPFDRAASAFMPTAAEATLAPPAKITHTKRVRVVRYYRQVIGRRLAALWRPDASAGPNPGGAFYGPPNVNVGYINPRWARAPSLARVSVRLQRCEFSADVAAARQPRPAGGITCRRPAFVSQ
jgi:hypothetical protein